MNNSYIKRNLIAKWLILGHNSQYRLEHGYRWKIFFIINTLFLFKIFYHQSNFIGLYLAICSNLLLEDPFASYWGHTFRCINQIPNLVGIHGVYFRFHGIKPFVKVTIHDSFRIGRRIIILNDVECIVILNDKSVPEWYIMHSTWPSERRCMWKEYALQVNQNLYFDKFFL